MEINKLKSLLGEDWTEKLVENGGVSLLDGIFKQVRDSKESTGKEVFPQSKNVFKAFLSTKLKEVKAVILAQDPYFTKSEGKIVADGLAFSCSNTPYLQSSLNNFYNGIEQDLHDGFNIEMNKNNNLSYLAENGVLLLNSSLTVLEKTPGSHMEIWKPFIIKVIDVINVYCENVVFILIGKNAAWFENNINPISHHVLKTEHPAAASYSGNVWKHNNIFSKTNALLKEHNKTEINWIQ